MQPMHGETTSILTQAKHSKAQAVQLKHCVGVHVSICGAKMAQYHHFWKFLARKHCFGNN